MTEDIEIKIKNVPIEPELVRKKMQVSYVLPIQRRKFIDYLKEKSSTKNLLEEIID